MAATTYRVIQEPHQRGTLSREQVSEAIREAIAVLARRDAARKARASSKKNRGPAKS